jgi:type II secretory pathway component PulF
MSRGALTLEQLTALNEEMAAIARMGVPMELGLRDLGKELPGRLGRATETLQEKLDRGQDLATALSESTGVFPAAYRAIILAGLTAGNLPAAFQSVAESARRLHEVRRNMRLAWFYPLLVVMLSYAVLVAFAVQWIPTLVSFYQDAAAPSLPLFEGLMALSDTAGWWGPIVPCVVMLALAVWYFRGHGAVGHPLHRMRYQAAMVRFTELLASMLEHGVPLPRALPLAAQGTGSAAMQATCRRWSEQLARGEPASRTDAQTPAVPDWVAWLLNHGGNSARLAENLRRSAENYRRDLLRQAQWFSRAFPIWITIAVGGTATVVTAVLVAAPWFYVLLRLVEP